MGCRQSSVVKPPPISDGPPPPRVAWEGSSDGQCADPLTVPGTSEKVLSKQPTGKRKRKKKVRPMKVVPVVSATKMTVGSPLTRGNRVILPPLQRRPLPPGIMLVQEASPDSRVDLTNSASPAAQNRFRRALPRTPLPPLKNAPMLINQVAVDPKPESLSQSCAHEDSTHQSLYQPSEFRSNATPSDCPPTLHPPTLLTQQQFYTSIRPPVSKMYGSVSSDSDSEIQSQSRAPSPLIPLSLRPLSSSTFRMQHRSDNQFQEAELCDPVSSGESSDDECVDGSQLPLCQRRSPRRSEEQQSKRMPRPTAALPSRRKDWARGLYDHFPPEEYNTRRGTYIRGSDDSVSSSSCSSESDISLKYTSPPCPEVPAGREVPDEPNIVARPNTRGGVAFEYLLVLDVRGRPNTPMVPRPMSRRTVRRRRRKTLMELDLQQRLAELRREQLQLEKLARLKAQE